MQSEWEDGFTMRSETQGVRSGSTRVSRGEAVVRMSRTEAL